MALGSDVAGAVTVGAAGARGLSVAKAAVRGGAVVAAAGVASGADGVVGVTPAGAAVGGAQAATATDEMTMTPSERISDKSAPPSRGRISWLRHVERGRPQRGTSGRRGPNPRRPRSVRDDDTSAAGASSACELVCYTRVPQFVEA